MITVSKLSENVWKFTGSDRVNCYLLLEEKMMIDSGNPDDAEELKKEIGKIINLEQIKKIILTHLHYDHSGNISLFSNAILFASQQEIDAFDSDAMGAVLDTRIVDDVHERGILPLPGHLNGFEIVPTPGHTAGSTCLIYKKDKILFTGDTKFGEGRYGRTDLPTSMPELLNESIQKLEKYTDLIFAPGHDYYAP